MKLNRHQPADRILLVDRANKAYTFPVVGVGHAYGWRSLTGRNDVDPNEPTFAFHNRQTSEIAPGNRDFTIDAALSRLRSNIPSWLPLGLRIDGVVSSAVSCERELIGRKEVSIGIDA